MKKHNFSAGPCILPNEVLEEASKAIINFNNDSLSLIEISHRSTPFVQVMDEAKQLVKELLAVPDNYSILFLQGGASLEFLMVPFNLLSTDGKCAYINTGTWSKKAIGSEGARASKVRSVIVALDGRVQPAPIALFGANLSA